MLDCRLLQFWLQLRQWRFLTVAKMKSATATAFPFVCFGLQEDKACSVFFGAPMKFDRVVLVVRHAEGHVCFQRSLVVFGPVQ